MMTAANALHFHAGVKDRKATLPVLIAIFLVTAPRPAHPRPGRDQNLNRPNAASISIETKGTLQRLDNSKKKRRIFEPI
jgi:hypothetical protein